MRRIAALLTCLAGAALIAGCAATGARASDAAEMRVIGFSADSRIYAFEEYGVQDGSGFAYSNIYLVDLAEDKFVADTPVRVQATDQDGLGKTRDLARRRATAVLERYGVQSDPGAIAAFRAAGDLDVDGKKIRFNRYPAAPAVKHPYTVTLEETAFPAPKDCLNMTGAFSGFTLRLTEADGAVVDRILYKDATAPSNRTCPNGYRIGAIVMGGENARSVVAMVQMSRMGFEGSDLRWIAVPITLTAQ